MRRIDSVERCCATTTEYPSLERAHPAARKCWSGPEREVALLETTVKVCLGPFCRNVTRVERVQSRQYVLLRSRIPSRSDVKFGETRSELSPDVHGGTLVKYVTNVVPELLGACGRRPAHDVEDAGDARRRPVHERGDAGAAGREARRALTQLIRSSRLSNLSRRTGRRHLAERTTPYSISSHDCSPHGTTRFGSGFAGFCDELSYVVRVHDAACRPGTASAS